MRVSCIMPTRGRTVFAEQALQLWQLQTWADKELIIVDDAECPSFPHGLHVPGVSYHLLERRLTIGAKRNYACDRAGGSIIATWDDDEWYNPERIEDQVISLLHTDSWVAGYHSMRFVDVRTQQWWRYRGSCAIAIGSSICYLRSFWQANRFPDIQLGEDNYLIGIASRAGKLISADAVDMQVSYIHSGNTSTRESVGRNKDAWRECLPLPIPIPCLQEN